MLKSANTATAGSSRLVWGVIWLAIIATLVIFQSGFYNPDSFKYVTIANTMLTQHHYILPFYHGHPYSDKGPFMFWLFILGWKITGFNHWWPQLLIALTASAALYVTVKIAETLWPEQPRIKQILPIVLLGLPSWIVLSNEIRIDIFLMFFCLSGLLSLLLAFKQEQFRIANPSKTRNRYWIYYGLSLTLGFLCKGPVILLYTFVPALLLPFIFTLNNRIKLSYWYGYLILSTLVAIALALCWAIPAALMGGHTYTHSIFLNQVYHRAFEYSSFFYYIIRIPLFLLPWCLYLPFLLGSFKYSKLLDAEKFCWLVILLSLIVFSFYGQKRVHYLDPDFPLLALIIARAISNYMSVHKLPKLSHQWFVSIFMLFIAGSILVLPHFTLSLNSALQAQLFYFLKYNFLIAALLVALAGVYFFCKPKTIMQQMVMIMVPTAAVSTALLVLRVTG